MKRNEGSQVERESDFGEEVNVEVRPTNPENLDGTGLTKEDFQDVKKVLDETTAPMPSAGSILEIYKEGSPTENILKPTGTDSRSEVQSKLIKEGVEAGARTGKTMFLFRAIELMNFRQVKNNSDSSSL